MIAGGSTDDPAGALKQARAGVVEQLRARRPEIEEAIFARVSDRWFDRTGSGDPEYVVGLRAAGVAALDFVLTGVERSGESLEPVPAAVSVQARRAAGTGVGLDTVLRRYLAGYALLEGFVIQEVERGELLGQGSALRDVLRIIYALVDRLIAVVSSAYNKEVEQRGETAQAGKDIRVSDQRNGGCARARSGARSGSRAMRAAPEGTQRERILAAIIGVVAERGCAGASVGLVVERARVSRPTFYKMFPRGLEDGLVAVMDTGLERVGALASEALEREESWRDGMRAALASVLLFFDSQPDLARVLMVETLGGRPAVVDHREGLVEAFRELVVARIENEVLNASPLAAEGVLASVMSVVRVCLIARESRPLIELLGPLMGFIVEHVADRHMAAEETRRGDELARAIQAGKVSWVLPVVAPIQSDLTLPAIITNPTARRLRACVLYLAEQRGQGLRPSNREVGRAIGVSHKSQISKLLSQLRDEDLAVKRSVGPGGPNEWRLTLRGEEVARALDKQEG